MALCNGGSLHLGSREELLASSELAALVQREQVSMLTVSPSVLAALAVETLAGVETLITAGEACSGEVVERWGVGRRLYNAYGPTETTVWATIEECVVGEGRPSIGRVIPHQRGYVLDEQMELVPIGVEGELYVGGEGVARGYVGRGELTGERYVPDPWGVLGGERLYRTGDVVRYREDGKLEYRGRRDGQVKVRGYRIELGEIEEALLKEEGVKDAVVVVREEGGERQLVGYVVREEGKRGGGVKEWREGLRKRLPQYMVPGVLVELERLPMTPNAKVDLRALPAPIDAQYTRESASVVPGTPLEQNIVNVWREILHVETIGIYDNFFDLGGHSLLLVRLQNRLQEVLTREISMMELFQHTTVHAQAVHLTGKQKPEKASSQQSVNWADKRKEAIKQQWAFKQRLRVTKERGVNEE